MLSVINKGDIKARFEWITLFSSDALIISSFGDIIFEWPGVSSSPFSLKLYASDTLWHPMDARLVFTLFVKFSENILLLLEL